MKKINATPFLSLHNKHGDSFDLHIKFRNSVGGIINKVTSTMTMEYWNTKNMHGPSIGQLNVISTESIFGDFTIEGWNLLDLGTYYAAFVESSGGNPKRKFDMLITISNTYGSGQLAKTVDNQIIIQETETTIVIENQ